MLEESSVECEQLHAYLQLALEMAKESGAILHRFWGHVQHVRDKGIPGDLVTEADKASDQYLLTALRKAYPHHAILTEESGKHTGEGSEFLWVIDPLDGTVNYAHHHPFFAVSIALLHKGEPIVGVVYNPIYKELFHAAVGLGAFLNGEPIEVSKEADLAHTLLATGFPYDRRENPDNNYAEFIHLTNLTQGVRRFGSAALDLAYVACGRIDGYWEKGIKPWDIAAGALLVKEAGGAVSNDLGEGCDLFSGRIVATNQKIHKQLVLSLLSLKAF